MIRVFVLCAALLAGAPSAGVAENDVVRIDAAQSSMSQNWRGETTLSLGLSKAVPFRVYTLDTPARLVIDVANSEWSGADANELASGSSAVSAIRFGTIRPGWSRLVADLTEPVLPHDVSMTSNDNGFALLSLRLAKADPEVFAKSSGAPETALWPRKEMLSSPPSGVSDRFVVVLDPGHGGIDPGAERKGVTEKALMLTFARELRSVLQASGDVDVVMTREEDVFVSLQARVAAAHHADADLFLSLHADALTQGGAQGATVYTLSKDASDAASAQLAARHNRADVLAGIDLTGSDDQVTGVLLDLARQETAPRAQAFAHSLAKSLDNAGGPVNRRALRSAGFTVLKSADIPSVLLEVGFLSSARDLSNLTNPAWRAGIAQAIDDAIDIWRQQDETRRALLRQ